MSREGTRLAYSTEAGGDLQKRSAKRGRAAAKPAPGSASAASSASKKASGQGVRIRLDRRASDRLVTVITGLPRGSDAAQLTRQLKAACGAGGTTKGGSIEIQGDHRDAVAAELSRRGLAFKRSGG